MSNIAFYDLHVKAYGNVVVLSILILQNNTYMGMDEKAPQP